MMVVEYLVITGTEAAGKTSIADELVRKGTGSIVVAVTTRAPRPDDASRYKYLTDAEFDKHYQRGDLAVSTAYRDKKYGVLRVDLEAVRTSGKLPILTLAPDSVAQFGKGVPRLSNILSVFIDAEDSSLDVRIAGRGGTPDQERRMADRTFRADATYALTNHSLHDCVVAIETLIEASGRGGVLPFQWILRLGQVGMLLEGMDKDRVQAASYDLSLGDEYFYGGRIKRLSSNEPILTIEPYDSAIVTSKERARLPGDVAGRFDLSVGLFSQGVILSNGPQIDPGFEGSLFCLLLNTSSSPVLLRRGQHYASLEFYRLIEPSAKPYSGPRQGKESILDYLPTNAARGAINDLKRELEQLRKESARLQTFFIAALSLMFAVSALLTATR